MRRIMISLLLALSAGVVLAQDFSQRYPAYQLERSDVLEVKYRYTPEFDQTLTVGPDGRVSLVGLGDLHAAGLTLDKFRHDVEVLSSKKLVKPVVTVTLKEFDKPHVYVEGEVNTPGRVDFRSDISIGDAIAMAGGVKNSGNQSQILVLNRADGKTHVINLKKLVDQHHLEEVDVLNPGDVIYVPQNGLSKVERLAHLGQFGAIYSPVR